MGIQIDRVHRRFYLPYGTGRTVLNFDILHERAQYLAKELGEEYTAQEGDLASAQAYVNFLKEAEARHLQYGFRSCSHLTPDLIGLEGKRVEVETEDGKIKRFIVGRSSGFIPIHLEIKTRRSPGGHPVTGWPYRSVRVLAGC